MSNIDRFMQVFQEVEQRISKWPKWQQQTSKGQIKKMKKTALQKKVAEVHDLIKQCQELADKEGVTFSLYPGYSMGGTYYSPKALEDERLEGDWRINEGWMSSTKSCN